MEQRTDGQTIQKHNALRLLTYYWRRHQIHVLTTTRNSSEDEKRERGFYLRRHRTQGLRHDEIRG